VNFAWSDDGLSRVRAGQDAPRSTTTGGGAGGEAAVQLPRRASAAHARGLRYRGAGQGRETSALTVGTLAGPWPPSRSI
jgi:hypothetical protein